MSGTADPRFTMEELEEASGISARTIRYYIAQDLVPPSKGHGRSAYYTTEHIERLSRIAALKEQGLSIAEIRNEVHQASSRLEAEAQHWEHFVLQPDLVVQIREDASDHTRIFVRRVAQLANDWFDSES